MLIEKRTTTDINDIVTIKLLSGEEIIGRLVDRTNETIVLGKPVQILMQPIGTSQMGLAFHPVLGSVSDMTNVPFILAALSVRPVRTNDDVTRNYIQATTGLMPANAEQIATMSKPR